MTQPSHTHKEHGGRFGQVTTYWGSGPLDGQQLVVYQDLDRVTESLTTMEDWQQNWRPIEADTCTVCMGTGKDAIKGNRSNPCGGCYGLGKVMPDGKKPKDEWQVADVAGSIIEGLRAKLDLAHRAIEAMQRTPGVPEAIDAERERSKERQQKEGPPDWVQREQDWRGSRGQGAGGGRMTGD